MPDHGSRPDPPAGRSVVQDRNIHYSCDFAGRRIDPVDLLLIGFRYIEVAADTGHAIGRSIGLEIVWVRVHNRVGHQVLTAVGYRGPGVIRIDPDHTVWKVRHAMRAAGTSHHRIEGIADELHIR